MKAKQIMNLNVAGQIRRSLAAHLVIPAWEKNIPIELLNGKSLTRLYIRLGKNKGGRQFWFGKTYSLCMPVEMQVQQFWSLTIYDPLHWVFIYSPPRRPGLSSCELDKMKKNINGSVTLYFGPKAPRRLESNWIRADGKIPFSMFRFYGD